MSTVFIPVGFFCSVFLYSTMFFISTSYFIFSPSPGFSTPQSKPLQGFPFAAHQQLDSPAFLPLSFHGYQPSPFGSAASGGLDAGLAMKAGASLLESSALWDMAYGTRPARLGADLSSGSSGYQSGTSHTGRDQLKVWTGFLIVELLNLKSSGFLVPFTE